MSVIIDGHIIDETLITDGWILDAGCRYFNLSKAFPDNKMICLDPDKSITPPENVLFINKALYHKQGTINFACWSYGDGNCTFTDEREILYPHAEKKYIVETITISDVMELYSIKQFDLIKLDIEGDEYNILENINSPIAKQIAVEFHDFTGRNPFQNQENKYNGDEYYPHLLNSDFGKYYYLAQESNNEKLYLLK